MANFELRIRGGRVFSGGGLIDADVLIQSGRIAALLSPGEDVAARASIDATGQWILPGIIDTHAHTREPGYEYKEDFLTASQAAAAGGVTTMIDMPNVEPPTSTVEAFLAKRELAAAKSIIDYGHWVAPTQPDQIGPLADAGATGFKVYQVSGAYPHDPRLAVNDDGTLVAMMRAVQSTGLPLLVHPFNQSLFDRLSQDAFDAGKPPNWDTFSEVYTTESIWHTAVNTLINLQSLTDVRLHLVHTHSGGSIRLVRAAKEAGRRVTAAIDPKYYHLTQQDLAEQTARICPAGYVTEDPERMAIIWRGLEDGTIDMIDSDHAPHTLEELEQQNDDAWHAAMGSPQYDWQYSIVLTDIANGHLSLGRAVSLLSEAPAKLLGIYPRKGALVPGADADLVLVDPTATRTLTDDGLYTKAGWTPYRGRMVQGVVTLTMLRGTVIARDRTIVGSAGFGQYIAGIAQ